MKGLLFCVFAIMVLTPAQGKMSKVYTAVGVDQTAYSVLQYCCY